MKNYGMMEYGFIEATEFEGIMPKTAEMIGTVGASDVIVEMFGADAKGADSLEVVDVQKAFAESAAEESSEEPMEEEVIGE